MYDEGLAIGTNIKINKLETIIYKLKKQIELDDKEIDVVNKILESKDK